ncbi:MAG: efflux RND transporter permease subunit [Desulfobacterales bacterium]
MKGAVRWFTENHVAANLLMLFLIIGGIIVGTTIKLEVFPETTLDKISISTVYPGASPSEVEEGVVRRIEEKISGLAGIKRIDSVIREGYGAITVEVMTDWDLKKLLDEVKAEVDRITTFPEEAEQPVVREIVRRSQVINLAVYGDASESTIKHIADTIKDDLTNLPGVTQAEVSAVREREIHIEISENTLRKYALTLGQVADMVARSSFDLPAGSVKTQSGEILIRTKGKRYYADDFRDIAVISRTDGSRVTLGRIAEISDGFQDVDMFARFQGKPAAMINVFRVADQSALSVAGTVRDYVKKIEPDLPNGVNIEYFGDMSVILKSRIELLMKNMIMGLILVVIILGVFLNIRLSFWVTLGIPISFAAGLMFLPQFDVSINMISLFAFIMILGIVVDDAIIVGENVYRKHEEGMAALPASVEGTLEVGRPVIFSVLTTMVAFWPLLTAGGVMGNITRNIPIVVILVLAGSLIESLLILPAHLNRSKIMKSKTNSGTPREKFAPRMLKKIIEGPYSRLLEFSVKWRYATVAFGIAILLVTLGTWQAGWIKFTFFPRVDGDTLECLITMPSGTPAERTFEVVTHYENAAREALAEIDARRPESTPSYFEHSISLVGGQFGRHGDSGDIGGHLAQIWIQLLDAEERDMASVEILNHWRKKAGSVPDAETISFKSDIHSAGNAIEIHLSMEDQEQLLTAADELKEELEKIAGVFDISDSFLPGKQELQLRLKPAASTLGLTLNDLARQVRHAFYGAEALRMQRDRDEVKVLVRYPEDERKSLTNAEEMRIRTPAGDEVPFSQVAELEMDQGYATIQRAQRQRVIKVMADVNEKVANANEVRAAVTADFMPNLVKRYPGLRYTLEGEGREQNESLGDISRGFMIALFGIYALLAVPFRSFSQPIVVMAAIPFGIVGAVVGHLTLGYNLSMMSLMGIVGLSGVVVNDSLVLIHRANKIRSAENANSHDAIVKAGALRFRAIILTSLTTFAGLTPIMLEQSVQARFITPMAISLGFGVLFATFVTLFLIPCLYMMLEDGLNLAGRIRGWFFLGEERRDS